MPGVTVTFLDGVAIAMLIPFLLLAIMSIMAAGGIILVIAYALSFLDTQIYTGWNRTQSR